MSSNNFKNSASEMHHECPSQQPPAKKCREHLSCAPSPEPMFPEIYVPTTEMCLVYPSLPPQTCASKALVSTLMCPEHPCEPKGPEPSHDNSNMHLECPCDESVTTTSAIAPHKPASQMSLEDRSAKYGCDSPTDSDWENYVADAIFVLCPTCFCTIDANEHVVMLDPTLEPYLLPTQDNPPPNLDHRHRLIDGVFLHHHQPTAAALTAINHFLSCCPKCCAYISMSLALPTIDIPSIHIKMLPVPTRTLDSIPTHHFLSDFVPYDDASISDISENDVYLEDSRARAELPRDPPTFFIPFDHDIDSNVTTLYHGRTEDITPLSFHKPKATSAPLYYYARRRRAKRHRPPSLLPAAREDDSYWDSLTLGTVEVCEEVVALYDHDVITQAGEEDDEEIVEPWSARDFQLACGILFPAIIGQWLQIYAWYLIFTGIICAFWGYCQLKGYKIQNVYTDIIDGTSSTIYNIVSEPVRVVKTAWKHIAYAYLGVKRARKVIDTAKDFEAEFKRWTNILSTGNLSALTQGDTIRLNTIKAALHTAYHVYRGEQVHAISHATYIVTLNPQAVVYIKANIDQLCAVQTDPRIEVEVFGTTHHLTPDEFKRYQEFIENGGQPLDFEFSASTQAGNPFSTVIAGLFTTINTESMTDFDIRCLNNQLALYNNSRKLTEDISSSALAFVSLVGKTVFGVDPLDTKYQNFVGQVLHIISQTRDIEARPQDYITSLPIMNNIKALWKDSLSLQVHPQMSLVPHHITRPFNDCMRTLCELNARVNAHMSAAKVRETPFCVFIGGAPGTGKSKFLEFGLPAVSIELHDDYQNLDMFAKSPDSPYWEGYNKQVHVLCDDYWQNTIKEIRATQSTDFIMMNNNIPFSLNMAFEAKGTMLFDSEFIWVSTNLARKGIRNASFENVGVTDPEAITRRIHLSIIAEKKFLPGCEIPTHPYFVEVCVHFPHEEGKTISGRDLAFLIARCRRKQLELSRELTYSNDKIRDILYGRNGSIPPPLEDVTHLFEEEDDDSAISADANEITYTPYQNALTCARLGLFSWYGSSTAAYYTIALALVLGISVAITFWNTFFPPRTAAPEDFFETQAHVEEEGSAQKKKKPANRQFFNRPRSENHKRVAHKASQRAYEHHERMSAIRGLRNSYAPAYRGRQPKANAGKTMFIDSVLSSLGRAALHLCVKTSSSEPGTTCQAFHIKDHYIGTCAHWLVPLLDKDPSTFQFAVCVGGTQYVVPFPSFDDIIMVENFDFIIFRIPTHISGLPSVYKNFLSCEKLPSVDEGTQAYLITTTAYGNLSIRPLHLTVGGEYVRYPTTEHFFELHMPHGYFENTKNGDSGGMVVACGPQGQTHIIGMHVATRKQGGKNLGLALPLFREDVDMYIAWAKGDVNTEPLEGEVVVDSGKACVTYPRTDYPAPMPMVADLPVIPCGYVDPTCAHYVPRKSKIQRSKLYGYAGSPTMIPAALDKRNGIDPLHVALSSVYQGDFVAEMYPANSISYFRTKYPRNTTATRRVLTLHEALNGVDGTNIVGIRRNTSAGYLFKNGNRGKCGVINISPTDGLKYATPEFEDHIRYCIHCLENDIPLPVYWADTLKDETRPIEKVKQGKTRLISCGPVDIQILQIMYTGAMRGYFKSDPVHKPMAVGINASGIDWTRLANRLQSKGETIISADFAAYDKRLPHVAFDGYVDFANWWYNDELKNGKVRRAIFDIVKNATHIVGNVLYKPTCGGPSGHSDTSEVNGFHNVLSCHNILVNHLGVPEDEFEMSCYGDDQIIAVNKPGIKVEHLAKFYKTLYNMDYTHWTKRANYEDDDLTTVRFLGRKFVQGYCGMYQAPLDLRTVIEALYWRHADDPTDALILSTVSNFMTELSNFPEDVYDAEITRLMDYCNDDSRQFQNIIALLSSGPGYNRRQDLKYFESTVEPNSGRGEIRTDVPYLLPRLDSPVGFFIPEGFSLPDGSVPTEEQIFALHRWPREENHVMNLGGEWYDVLRDYEVMCMYISNLATPYRNVVLFEFQLEHAIATMIGPYYARFIARCLMLPAWFYIRVNPNREGLAFTSDGDVEPNSGVAETNQIHTVETRNTEFTDRADNDVAPTQQMQLGAVFDAAPVSSGAVDSSCVQEPYDAFPVEYFDLNGILDRLLPITTATWDPAAGSGTLITTLTIPGDLKIQPVIEPKMLDFKYCTMAGRVVIKVAASKSIYGVLLVCYCPKANTTITAPASVYLASGYPHALVSAAQSGSEVIDISLIIRTRVMDIPNGPADEMGKIFIYSLGPLRNTNGEVANAKILTQAQFVDAKVYMPHTTPVPASRFYEKVNGKMIPIDLEINSGTSTGVEFINGKFETIEIRVNSGVGQSVKEIRAKAAAKSIAAAHESRDAGTSAVRALTSKTNSYFDTFKSFGEAALTTLQIGSMLGLSKPSTLDTTSIGKINPYSDLNTGKGIDCSTKFSLNPECGISTVTNVAGISVDEMAIDRIVGTPMLANFLALSESDPAVELVILSNDTTEPTYVDTMTTITNFWYGGFKVKVYGFCSQFHSAKVAVWVSDNATSNYQDCYHQIYDFQGDTSFDFSVSYLEPGFAAKWNATATYKMYIKILNWSLQDVSINVPIYFAVYKAAAPGFKVFGLKDLQFQPDANVRADFTKDFPPFHESMKTYEQVGICVGEEIQSLREIMHRYIAVGTISGPSRPAWAAPNTNMIGLHFFGNFFAFWRGSLRGKMITTTPNTIESLRWSIASSNMSGVAITSPTNPVLEYEVPWYSEYAYNWTSQNSEATLWYSTVRPKFLFEAAGDDFSFHFLKPWPRGGFTTPTGSRGTQGLVTFTG